MLRPPELPSSNYSDGVFYEYEYHFGVYFETELLFEKFVFAQPLLLASGS